MTVTVPANGSTVTGVGEVVATSTEGFTLSLVALTQVSKSTGRYY